MLECVSQIVRCLLILLGSALIFFVAPAGAVVPDVQLRGFIADVGSATDIAVDTTAGLAYTSSYEFGLSVVDLATPGLPTVMSAVSSPYFSDHVASSGNLAV
ncbi:MAG: hypothetical protein ACHQ9S_15260, partial [Candidatus Binatia bacterium]